MRLESDGPIVRTKRNIKFPDLKNMRDVGDFNQRYLHLSQPVPAATHA